MRVLLIEDEATIADAVGRGLTAEGHDVDVVADGADGLWRAREGSYDLIVLDLLLPSMNGYKVCAALRADGDATPILMLTAKAGEYDEAEGLDTGADDYLTKPFSLVVLLARVRALLRREPRPLRTDMIEVADLAVDVAARRCTRAGRQIPLTQRELALLEVLCRNREVVLTKRTLLDRVWGPDFQGGENVVEVYIGYLRRKVDDPFDPPLIETVRGHGYRISAR
jgi:DNA-binding response OmpR family regulator